MRHRNRTGPIYLQMAATLRDQIKAKRFLEGEYLPSERQLAERFGVTQVTLRRALAVLRDEGLVASEPGRGNRVVWSAPPVSKLVNMFFFKWISPFEDPVLSRLCTGIASACSHIGYKLGLTYPPPGESSSDQSYLDWFSHHLESLNANGVIVLGSPEYYDQIINRIETRFPTVLVGASDCAKQADVIEPDYETAMQMAVRHAVELGRRQLVLLADVFPEDPQRNRRNIDAFKQAAIAQGYSEDELVIWMANREAADAVYDSGYYVSEDLLAQTKLPAAFITVAPSLAINALSMLSKAGLSVPHDVALISVQDDMRLGMLQPPVSGIDILGQSVGELAVTRLRERLEAPTMPRRSEFASPCLMVRGSCEQF